MQQKLVLIQGIELNPGAPSEATICVSGEASPVCLTGDALPPGTLSSGHYESTVRTGLFR